MDYTATVLLGKTKVKLEIADTQEKREQGYMFRPSIKENTGMLFVFDDFSYLSFWMKNVNFPLDIIYLANNKIVDIHENLPGCLQEPCDIYYSYHLANMALELPGGSAKKYGLQVGDELCINLSDRKNRVIQKE